MERHAHEAHRLGARARAAHALDDARVPRVVGREYEVPSEELVRIAREGLPDPVGEEADARHARARDDERGREYA